MRTADSLIRPKKSWANAGTHYLAVLSDPWYEVVANVQHQISYHTTLFYATKGIKTLHLPVTTCSVSSPMGLGSDSLPVRVNLHGVDVYLADSMQFMLEYGCRLFDKGCYYIMPSFRGEDVDERHLSQFFHSEAEIPGGLDDVMSLVEEYLKYLCVGLLSDLDDEIMRVAGRTDHIEAIANLDNLSIPRISFDQAVDLLGNNPLYIETHEAGFRTISVAGERRLTEMLNGMVWLTHFDYLSVPFYQAMDPRDNRKVLNADLLMGRGEVVGSGERHTTGDEVVQALMRHDVPLADYDWYHNLKASFPMRTAGFGLGIERFILWLLKHDDIRDCQLLPRFKGKNGAP